MVEEAEPLDGLRLCVRDQYVEGLTVMHPRQQNLVLHCKDSAPSISDARVAY